MQVQGRDKVFKRNYCHSISSQVRRDENDEQQAEERRGRGFHLVFLKEIPREWIAS